MTQFQRAITQEHIKCDICGGIMHPMYGGGWENDKIICAERECGAEITYPTSTPVPVSIDDIDLGKIDPELTN